MPNIIYRKIASTHPVESYLIDVISASLRANQKVLWLVPGGSAINVAAAASRKLGPDHLENLTVTLTDERYGPVGHADSNWPQLKSAGFELHSANLQPVLVGKGLEQTVSGFARTLDMDLKTADYSLALIGMGPDGHICGIKPRSPATSSNQLAVGYEWEDFTRITATLLVLKQLDEVVLYAIGQEKWPQLDKLEEDIDPMVQPAQLLKQLKKVIIYNDYKGDPTK